MDQHAPDPTARLTPLPTPPLQPPALLTTAELLRRGHGHVAIRAMVRSGELTHVRRGHYLARPGDDEGLRRARIHAALASGRESLVVSHGSAALLWGLPVRRAATDQIQLSEPGARRSRQQGDIHLHGGALPPGDVVERGRLRLTSVERTVVDLARSQDLRWALVSADAALHRGMATRESLLSQLESQAGTRGMGRARPAIVLADALVESPGESLCRAAIRQHGLPDPELQHNLYDEAGFVGRVDFWWKAQRVVLEFDGREKYFANARPGTTPQDVLWAEKKREDRLRALGCIMVRCTWDEVLHHPEVVARRVLQALERAVVG